MSKAGFIFSFGCYLFVIKDTWLSIKAYAIFFGKHIFDKLTEMIFISDIPALIYDPTLKWFS